MTLLEYLKMHESVIQEIKDCLKLDGDFLYFRPFKGDSLIKILKSIDVDKKIWLIHNSLGLEPHTNYDLEKDGKILYPQGRFANNRKNLICKLESNLGKKFKNYQILDYKTTNLSLSKITCIKFSVIILDSIQYKPTLECLNFFTKYLEKGGKIIVTNFIESSNNLSTKAVKDYINKNPTHFIQKINRIQKCIILQKIDNYNFQEVTFDAEHTNPISQPYSNQNIKLHYNSDEIVIVCVLKTGGIYDYNYVNALSNSVKQHVTIKHKFVCLTNDSTGFNKNVDEVVYFKHAFPKWWAKIELFRPDLFNDKRVFFLDLDTIILRNIDHILCNNSKFLGLRDFYKPHDMGSGLLFWEHNEYHRIYENFIKNSTYIINNTPEGDQRWIADNSGKISYFQDHFNDIFSYKKHCLPQNKLKIPKNASIICFHGKPKPHEINNDLSKYWNP